MSPTPPRVFLSYAWEDDAYRQRVESFATRLRQDGIDARLDAWHVDGTVTIPEFMASEVRNADKILLVCSPKYPQKIHAMEDGEKITGSGWEQMLVASAIWSGLKDRADVVVVVFRGTWRDATPSFASGLPSYDLTDDAAFEEPYTELLRRLTGQTKKAPPVGKPVTGLTPVPVPALRGTGGTAPAPAPEAYIAKLPATDSTLIGRAVELALLEAAWTNGANLLQVIAPGGTGKTALMTNWYKRHVGEAPLYGWSFYKQGTGDSANVSSDDFLNHAVGWFQLQPKANTAEAKAEALVHHLRQHRTLLILDGLEPLQNQTTGELNDYACKDLLRELSVQNAGLVLCTSRVALADLADVPPLELDNLTEADGARYLREKFGVHGSEEDLREASKAYGNHALAVTLLGTYLKRHGGDVSRRFEIDELPNPAGKPGDHAKRVMHSYAKQFAGQPEGDILRGLGFFDRPAEREALKLVLPEHRLDEAALVTLSEARLILSADALAPIDCHPLVREYFGALTKASEAEGFRAGHSKLFDYYCQVPKKEQPDTLEELTPLFHAVAHGCCAGRHQEARAKVFYGRILRGDEAYLIKKLGAYGTGLSLLAHFFEQPWNRPVPTLAPAHQGWVTYNAAFALRAVGRLADAVEPMRAGGEAATHRQHWENAARTYSNLSELLLTLGRTAEAVTAAHESVDYADRSGDLFQRLTRRAALADVLHQSGDRAEAARLFAEANCLQKKFQLDYPLLYSLAGYRYCDLLIAQGDHAEALRHATQALAWATRENYLLDIGLYHLTLGRAHTPDSHESLEHLEQSVAFLRRAGTTHLLPLTLLARATDADLAEVHKIATRSGMRLHLTDFHLAMARRLRSLEHIEKAEALIQQTGYHRRDQEAAALRFELQS
jgi:tetratricopeptide (TPR) repeat protein